MENTLRAREILKSMVAIAVFALFAIVLNIKVYGADFNASVSSGEVTQGENVTVTVTMSSGATVGAYYLALTYDANVLEYVSGADGGGGGSVQLYEDMVNNTTTSRTIIFKAIAAGSTKISVVKQGDICDIDLNDLTLKATDGTVTVKAPATASSNANLSSLSLMAVREDGWSGSVSLMPDFSKDVTSYQLWLGSEFNKLSISAVPEDGKAKVATAGTDLKAGQDNTTTITVTAEDGTVKTYTIIVHVKAETNTEGTTASENNNTDTPTEGPADNPQDTTTVNDNPSGTDDRNVTISEKSYTLQDVPEDLELPEGFERKTVSWNGTEVIGASDQSGTLILLYLQNNETSESRFYVYNSEKSSYTAFTSYTITQRSYVMLMADDDLIFEGVKATESNALELTTLNVAGDYVDAYKLKNAENIYIVKAMNWDNKIGYYYYSSIDGSMTPYFETVVKAPDNNPAQPVTASAEESNMTELLFWILVGLSVVLILIIVVLVVNLRRLSAGNREAEDDEDEEYDEADEYYDNNDDEEGRNNEEKENVYEEKANEEIKEADTVNKTDVINEADKINKADVINKADKVNEIEKKADNTKIMENKKENQGLLNLEKAAEDIADTNDKKEEVILNNTEDKPEKEIEKDMAVTQEPEEKEKPEKIVEQRSAKEEEAQAAADKSKKGKTETSKKKETAAESDVKDKNTAEQKEENMSEQELDNAIDDILGQLFK